MNKISKDQLDRISRMTGLKTATVQDLLGSGWMYTETLNQMPKWQRPDVELTAGTVGLNPSYRKIFLDTKDEADEVLRRMLVLIQKYGHATVGDMFELVSLTHTFRENMWGWKSLDGAKVTKVDNAWELKFPEPEHI